MPNIAKTVIFFLNNGIIHIVSSSSLSSPPSATTPHKQQKETFSFAQTIYNVFSEYRRTLAISRLYDCISNHEYARREKHIPCIEKKQHDKNKNKKKTTNERKKSKTRRKTVYSVTNFQ